jgi:hypothetical protein
MHMNPELIIRAARDEDWPPFAALERQVWLPRRVETVSKATFYRWRRTHPEGFLVAYHGAAMRGYIYCESIDFDPDSLDTPRWRDVVRAGYAGGMHTPHGNSVYGLSIASVQPGTGRLLLSETVRRARLQGKAYFVSICRLPGLGTFLEAARRRAPSETPLRNPDRLALGYAVQCVDAVGGIVHPLLRQVERPPDLPTVRQPDPVLSTFARFGKALYAVVRLTSFADPQSSGYGAVLVLDLTHLR